MVITKPHQPATYSNEIELPHTTHHGMCTTVTGLNQHDEKAHPLTHYTLAQYSTATKANIRSGSTERRAIRGAGGVTRRYKMVMEHNLQQALALVYRGNLLLDGDILTRQLRHFLHGARVPIPHHLALLLLVLPLTDLSNDVISIDKPSYSLLNIVQILCEVTA